MIRRRFNDIIHTRKREICYSDDQHVTKHPDIREVIHIYCELFSFFGFFYRKYKETHATNTFICIIFRDKSDTFTLLRSFYTISYSQLGRPHIT